MRHPASPLRRMIGLTLIELLVTLAIAAILGAIAYPSFMGSIYKSRRADASAGLMRVQQAMERWRSSNSAYTDNATLLGLTAPLTSPDGRYTLAISLANSGTVYQITATAVGAQVNDTQCGVMAVAMTNASLVYSSSSNGGSTFVTSGPCWAR